MSTYKSFAMIGVGDIGTHILNALISRDVHPLIITRKSSKPKNYPSSVKVVAVESYENIDEVSQVLKDNSIEVVICGITTDMLHLEEPIAEAAYKAGVNLFVPSEFGFVTEGASRVPEFEDGVLAFKDRLAVTWQAKGLPFARFFTGSFLTYVPWMTGYDTNGKVNIIGKGDKLISFTDDEDIGGFTAHVLTTLPSKELENGRCFRIEGDHSTLQDLAKRLKAEIVSVEKVPGETLGELKNFLAHFHDEGKSSTRYDHELQANREGKDGNDNYLWAGHKWKTFDDIGLGL